MKKKSGGTTKSSKAREELLQFLTQKKENQIPTEEKRKHIRILHNHHSNAEEILNELQQNESDYIERISSLKAYQSISKQSQKEKLFQTEWIDEQNRLQELLFKLEHSVTDTLQSLLLADVTLSIPINELLSMKEKQQNQRREMKTIYTNQLQDVKNLVNDFQNPEAQMKKAHNKKGKQNTEPEETQEQIEQKRMMVSSILADLLMKLRVDFQSKWNQLLEQEELLEKEIRSEHASFQELMKKELLEKQNQQISKNLFSIFEEIDISDIVEWNKSLIEVEKGNNNKKKDNNNGDDDEDNPLMLEGNFIQDSLVQTFLELTSPKTGKQQSPRSPRSPRSQRESFSPRKSNEDDKDDIPTTPSGDIKETVLNLLGQVSSESPAQPGDEKKQMKQHNLKFLLNDPDISPVLFQHLYEIYIMDQEFTNLLDQKKFERQQIQEDLGIFQDDNDENEEMISQLEKENNEDEIAISEQKEKEKEKKNKEYKGEMDNEDERSVASKLSTKSRNNPKQSPRIPASPRSTIGTNNSVAYGNFPDKASHEIFVKLYRKAEITGMPRKTLVELLQQQLCSPSSSYGLTMEEVLIHEEWYRKIRQLNLKYKQLTNQYYQQRNLKISNMKLEIISLIKEKKEIIEAKQQALLVQAKKDYLYQQMLILTKEREKKLQLLQQELLAKQVKDQELLLIQQELLRKENENKRKMLEIYHQEKCERERKQKERLEYEQQQEKLKLKELIEQNKSKILFRQQKIDEKRKQKKILEELAQEEEKKKIELLNKLAEQAPYWDIIKDIESRLDHATVSSQAQSFIPRLEGDELTRGHIPMNGFTDQKVIRDTRFRIVEALRMAGLSSTQAARDVVQQMIPRPHLAIHGIL